LSTGSGITLWAIFGDENGINFDNPVRLGADSLGEKGKKAELVGEECAKQLLEEIRSGATVDKHLADNLIPFMALVGDCKIKTSEVTMHTKTNIWVTEEFLGTCFEVDNNQITTKTL
jgi:RNA 3'-terminal phosphate cyclase